MLSYLEMFDKLSKLVLLFWNIVKSEANLGMKEQTDY
jgi:hypothetical protein